MNILQEHREERDKEFEKKFNYSIEGRDFNGLPTSPEVISSYLRVSLENFRDFMHSQDQKLIERVKEIIEEERRDKTCDCDVFGCSKCGREYVHGSLLDYLLIKLS